MPFSKYFAFVFVIVLLNQSHILAQGDKPIKFERFSIEDGLPSNRVFSITQDKQGYMWFGTDGGFCQFNGYEFKKFRNVLGDPNSLVNNRVNAIHADQYGIIWIATQNGLSRYDPTNNIFNNDNDILGKSVKCILETKNGDLWFGSDKGITKYLHENNTFISPWENNDRFSELTSTNVNSISEGHDGKLWIGTSSLGVLLFNPIDNSIQNLEEMVNATISLPSSNIPKVFVASNGEIWMGFLPEKGLGKYNPLSKSFTLYSRDSTLQPELWNRISDIIETEDHTIWISTYHSGINESGVHRYNPQTDLFERFTYDPYDPTSLSWPYSQCLYEDAFNNLWVGTSRGLNKADLKRWQMGHLIIDKQAPFNLFNNYYGIEEIRDGVFWLGLDGEGMVEWDRITNTTKVYATTSEVYLEGIHALQKDDDGNIWFGYSGDGIRCLSLENGAEKGFFHIEGDSSSLAGNYVSDLMIDRNNALWIATSNGLSRFNKNEENFTSWRQGEKNPGMSGNSLSSLYEDSKGFLWIGTRKHVYDPEITMSSGLMKYSPKANSFESFQHDAENRESISSDMVYCVIEDLNGYIWVGTDNGINRLDPTTGKFKVFLEKDGLPDPNIVGILIDNAGILWLITLNGLSRLDPVSFSFRNYSKDDGVQGNRYNDNSVYKTHDGELIFGGVSGANYFNPSAITVDSLIPEVFITKFLRKDQASMIEEQFGDRMIKLKWNENSVGIEFVSINFRTPEQTQYEYQLVGFDEDWTSLGNRRFVNYTNLNHGSYTFKVRVTNAEGVRSERDAMLSFRITPPIWQAWYAYVLYVLIIVLMIHVVDRYQRRNLVRKERERTKDRELEQAREIEKAYTDLKSTQSQLIQAEKMASLGELTAGIAHEIQNPLNFVNNFSEVSIEILDEMAEEIDAGNYDEAKEITGDLKLNLEKINHHGKRADSIVKGMLQHSRSSNGIKELVDINTLADEYLRLSYHGLRARDKSFNASIESDFDSSIGQISIVPQDIGRVLLNLLTNAFYVVNEKKNQNIEGYEATVGISTKKKKNHVEIRVKDNGNGIPQKIMDKIFHPFFTTKPSGEGTGLGLSMSYDIITKGHQGELKVNTTEGSGSEFIIVLPVKS